MTPREQALERIAEIAREHEIPASEIAEKLSPSGQVEAPPSSLLTRLFGYLGGIFVVAGLGVFIEMQWDEMNSFARIAVTLGSGIAAFVMAFVSVDDERMEKAATPLFLLAALLQPIGILVAIDEFSAGGDERHAFLLTAGILFIQQILVFAKTRRTVLLFTSLWFGSWFCGTAMDLIGLDEDLIVFTLGTSTLLVTYSIDRGPHRSITGFWYFVSSTAMLIGLFELLEDSIAEILFLGVACGVVFLSTWVRSRSLLLVATLAILSYVGYYTAQHFTNVVGWPIALIVFGLLLIGLSAFAFRIDRKYIVGR